MKIKDISAKHAIIVFLKFFKAIYNRQKLNLVKKEDKRKVLANLKNIL
jgi:hypothetical protein